MYTCNLHYCQTGCICQKQTMCIHFLRASTCTIHLSAIIISLPMTTNKSNQTQDMTLTSKMLDTKFGVDWSKAVDFYYTQTHTHMRTLTPIHMHMHARMQHTPTPTHASTHTDTHTSTHRHRHPPTQPFVLLILTWRAL